MFKFKGISSSEMKVIVEEEDNLIAKASHKYEQIDIDGMNGSIYNELGYSDVERSLKIYVMDISKIDDILSWLNGEGILEYKNRISKAFFYSTIEPQRSSSIKTIDFSFIRSPFWYDVNDHFVTVSDGNIYNYGNVYSTPIIKLEKNTSDSVDITVNEVRFIYNFDEDNKVEIDCEELNATCDGILKNRNLEIGFEFPILAPGNNKIVINSGDAIIKIKRKDCWL